MEFKHVMKPLTLSAQFMKWKEQSLKAFGMYRWLLRSEDSGALKIEILSNPDLKEFVAGAEGLGLEDMYYEIKDKIFSLLQVNDEKFFVWMPLEKKTHTLGVSEMLDFLTEHEHDSPAWWPSHFATPADCETWVSQNVPRVESTIGG